MISMIRSIPKDIPAAGVAGPPKISTSLSYSSAAGDAPHVLVAFDMDFIDRARVIIESPDEADIEDGKNRSLPPRTNPEVLRFPSSLHSLGIILKIFG